MKESKKNRGFVQLIIIIVLLIVILSLLGISLRVLFTNPTLQENFGFVGEWLSRIWHSYLATPFRVAWHAFSAYIVHPYLETLKSFLPGR